MQLEQTMTGAQKSKLTSFLVTTAAGMMLKTYMAMSHLWLIADKVKKANETAKATKTAQPAVLKTQM